MSFHTNEQYTRVEDEFAAAEPGDETEEGLEEELEEEEKEEED